MKEWKLNSLGEEAFRYKTKGVCKQEKKRTGRCGDCLDMDKLERKLDEKKKLGADERVDYSMLLRHTVWVAFYYLQMSVRDWLGKGENLLCGCGVLLQEKG
jgi:hypothetical protein